MTMAEESVSTQPNFAYLTAAIICALIALQDRSVHGP